MIDSHDVRLAAYVIDTSGVVDILLDGCKRDSRGRKTNPNHVRLFLIGGLLTLMHRGGFLVTHCYRVLTTEISNTDQHSLGVRRWVTKNGEQQLEVLEKHRLDYVTKSLNRALAYGESVDIDDDERVRRHTVIRDVWDALMDVFDLGFDHRTVAIDATGYWSWGRGSFSELASSAEQPPASSSNLQPD